MHDCCESLPRYMGGLMAGGRWGYRGKHAGWGRPGIRLTLQAVSMKSSKVNGIYSVHMYDWFIYHKNIICYVNCRM